MSPIGSCTCLARRQEDARKPLGRGTSALDKPPEGVCAGGGAPWGEGGRGGRDEAKGGWGWMGGPMGSGDFKELQLEPRSSREAAGRRGPNCPVTRPIDSGPGAARALGGFRSCPGDSGGPPGLPQLLQTELCP